VSRLVRASAAPAARCAPRAASIRTATVQHWRALPRAGVTPVRGALRGLFENGLLPRARLRARARAGSRAAGGPGAVGWPERHWARSWPGLPCDRPDAPPPRRLLALPFFPPLPPSRRERVPGVHGSRRHAAPASRARQHPSCGPARPSARRPALRLMLTRAASLPAVVCRARCLPTLPTSSPRSRF